MTVAKDQISATYRVGLLGGKYFRYQLAGE